MLVCVSANPAIDRRLRLKNIAVGKVNRALSAQPFPGGKAAHVAMVAKALDIDVVWAGFLGGAAGEECESGQFSVTSFRPVCHRPAAGARRTSL